jgi:putative lipoic acid-binding regulatory protein
LWDWKKEDWMMTNKQDAEKIYPCQFPVKVIGENDEGLGDVIVKVMSSLGEMVDPGDMTLAHSKNKKYVSITFKIVARSREHVDGIYSALSAQKEVKMVL